MFRVQIPFEGFYYSKWDAGFDDVLERDEAEPDLWDKVDWRAARLSVAGEYASRFMAEVAQDGEHWQFEALESPREYNFETDRVFVTVSEDMIRRWRSEVDASVLDAVARERHTSRDGFASFYSPDVGDWPDDVTEWDHNQLCTLLMAVLDDDDVEWRVFEDMNCNGAFESAIYEGVK